MAFLRVSRLTTGVPRDSDVNQYAKALSGEEDVGTLSLAQPVTAPASAGSASATLGSELGVGTYTYAVTYVTGHKRSNGDVSVVGETTASATWQVTTTAGNQRVNLTSLPVSANAVVVAKRIYRTVVGGAQLKLLATVSAGTTAYVDSVADASLGADVPTSNTTGSRWSLPTPTTSSEPATKGYADSTFPKLGTANTDVNLVKALNQETHTRSVVYTYTSGNVTKIEEKDGATVVKTTNIVYKVNGDVDYIDEIAGGKTVRTTYAYNADGTVSGETRSVT